MDDNRAADPPAADPPAADPPAATGEPAPDPERPARRHGTGPVYGLGAAAAALLVLGAVLAFGYVRTAGELTDRKRAAAAQAVELDRLRDELAAVNARRDQLAQDLAAAQAKATDPAGLELIKKCVQEYARIERAIKEALAKGEVVVSPDRAGAVPVQPGQLASPCIEAEPYLK
jgi:hypothetical protein